MESGTVRLNISHATSPENATQQKRHRLFSGVPAADIRPPDDVVSCGFRSVSLVMDILETSPRRGPKVKQPTTSTTDEQPFRSEIEDTVTHLFDADPADEALHHGRIDSNAIAASRKRKRPTVDTTSTSLEPLYGTLDSKALSHRTQLTPTIASSLTQLGFVRGTSISLKVKMESLGTATYGSRSGSSHQPGRIGQRDVALLKSSVASQLWMHSQRALLGNPAPLIQTCVVSDPHFVYTKPEDMLAEVDNRPSHAVYETWDKGLVLNNASDTLDEGSMLHPALRDAEEELLFDPVPYKVMSAIDSYGDGKPVSSYFRTGLSTSDIFDIQPPAPFRVRETQRVCEISHPAELAPTVYPSTVKDSSTALHEECLFAEYEKHVPNT
ncbi:hypothetical protein DDE82_000207 [Stemphylium lycopersici]|uniref:Uncharacterized protein n=1 Tax=Stemphylium lycopersici TaxID=183478 RepID=A0A364N5M3_STELY|nr:hypothetical protein DDE82_000207 [Stemphylium lycopersici]RAR12619.1 hypothetical protein DDE83_004016 [Stemphylium lycopersici]